MRNNKEKISISDIKIVHFYKRFGFEILKQREKGTLPVYKDLIKE